MASSTNVSLFVWIVVFTVIVTIMMIGRLWAARLTRRSVIVEDFLILFAWVNTIALESTAIWGIFRGGLGQPVAELTRDQINIQFKVLLSAYFCWLLGTVAIKIAILWFYIRVFSIPNFKRWAYGAIFLSSAYGLAFFVVFLTNCTPISQQWDPKPWGHCRNLSVEEISSVAFNILIDIIIVLLPFRPLWRLQLSLQKKVAITVMFGLGFLTIAIMIWRLQYTISNVNNPDLSVVLGHVALISFLELWVGIIVANMPMMAPLLQFVLVPLFGKLSRGSSTRAKANLQLANNTIGGGGPSNHLGGSRRKTAGLYSRFDNDDDDLTAIKHGGSSNMELTGVVTECTSGDMIRFKTMQTSLRPA